MSRIAVITDTGTSPGFRLAGIETFEANSQEEMQRKVADLIKAAGYGLIAVNEQLGTEMGDEVDRLLRHQALPVVLPFPVPKAGTVESGEAYLSKLVKDAIGFYVKLK